MGLTRDLAAGEVIAANLSEDETIALLRLIPQLPNKGEDIPELLTYAKPGQALKFLRLELQAAHSGGAILFWRVLHVWDTPILTHVLPP